MQRLALVLLLLLGGCWEVSAQGSKSSFITREALELRLKALERDRNQAIANVNAYDGAIQECNFWIELLKDAEQEEEAMVEFPKVKYHKDKKPVVVKDAEEEKALGSGWADSPAAFQVGPVGPPPNTPVVEEEPEEVPPPPLSEESDEGEKPKPKDKKKPK